ncbi:MAG: hypothetical protein IJ224_04140 [Lachnospiraceae bacterium]|nr:hypothetical protein [Lachnospiraceae bacterium]
MGKDDDVMESKIKNNEENKKIISHSYTLLNEGEDAVRKAKQEHFHEYNSFLDYTHDKEVVGGLTKYIYSDKKTQRFIDALMEELNEYYYMHMGSRLQQNVKKKAFYRGFFYLAIMSLALDELCRVDGIMTFKYLIDAARDSVMQLTKEEFINRYYALRWNRSAVCHIPGLLGKMDDYLYILNRSGFYMGNDTSYLKASKEYIRKYEEKFSDEEIAMFEIGDRDVIRYFSENSIIREIDRYVFEEAVEDYFDGLFLYGNKYMVDTVEKVIRLFLIKEAIRNNES